MNPKSIKILQWIVIVSAVIGMATSSYALYHHYTDEGVESFCDIDHRLSCSTVNKSSYSEIAGFPVAGIGLIGYLAIFLLAIVPTERKKTSPTLQGGVRGGIQWNLPFATSILGLVFQGYFTWIEFGILKTACILCITSQVMILVLAVATGLLYFHQQKLKQ